MNYYDYRPRFSPVIGPSSYRYSVGFYRGRRRFIAAWFSDEQAAAEYCRRCRSDRPYIKFDYLKSMF